MAKAIPTGAFSLAPKAYNSILYSELIKSSAISCQFLAERCGYWVFATTLSNSIRKSIVGGSLLPNHECRTSNAENIIHG